MFRTFSVSRVGFAFLFSAIGQLFLPGNSCIHVFQAELLYMHSNGCFHISSLYGHEFLYSLRGAFYTILRISRQDLSMMTLNAIFVLVCIYISHLSTDSHTLQNFIYSRPFRTGYYMFPYVITDPFGKRNLRPVW